MIDSLFAVSTRKSSFRNALIVGAVLCWMISTVGLLKKYLPASRSAMATALGILFVVGILFFLQRTYVKGSDLGRWCLFATFFVFVLSFAVLYPISQKHVLGHGSDREDALRVELVAITHHTYPYDARTFLGNPPTPLPGALWLAFPFFLIGRIALQNILWLALFLWMLSNFFKRRATAVAFVAVYLLFAFQSLDDLVVGSDYITNVLYIAIALFIFDRALRRKTVDWFVVFAFVLMGVVLSSRVIFLVTMVPLFALALQRVQWRRAVFLWCGIAFVSAAVTLPVFLPHPIHLLFVQLHQNSGKLVLLPHALRPDITLPLAALLVVCTAFLVRMDLARIYLLTGLGTLVMLLPPIVTLIQRDASSGVKLAVDLGYLAPGVIFLALWIFARFEQIHLPQSA